MKKIKEKIIHYYNRLIWYVQLPFRFPSHNRKLNEVLMAIRAFEPGINGNSDFNAIHNMFNLDSDTIILTVPQLRILLLELQDDGMIAVNDGIYSILPLGVGHSQKGGYSKMYRFRQNFVRNVAIAAFVVSIFALLATGTSAFMAIFSYKVNKVGLLYNKINTGINIKNTVKDDIIQELKEDIKNLTLQNDSLIKIVVSYQSSNTNSAKIVTAPAKKIASPVKNLLPSIKKDTTPAKTDSTHE